MNDLNTQPELLKLATVQCPKLSATASGLLTFEIWRDAPADPQQTPTLYVSLAANDGGGYFSMEKVPMTRIEECLRELQATGQGFPAIRLKTMFQGKSANNPSFMAAVLRHEGILAGATDNPKLNVVTANLEAWKTRMLALPPLYDEAPVENPKAPTEEVKEPVSEKSGKKRGKKAPEPMPEGEGVDTVPESVDESPATN